MKNLPQFSIIDRIVLQRFDRKSRLDILEWIVFDKTIGILLDILTYNE